LLNYSKADLLWESTKRNEDYKSIYYELANANSPKTKWDKIYNFGAYRWMTNGFLDPSISSEQINNKILNGEIEEGFHPYYHYFAKKEIRHHVIPTSILRPLSEKNDTEEYHRLIGWLCTEGFDETNRIFISFDIGENDDSIGRAIRKIKRELRLKLRKHEPGLQEESFNPAKIKYYIDWLIEYDRMVEHLKVNMPSEIKIIDGAICYIKMDFSIFIPQDSKPEYRASRIKQRREAYEGAVRLIQMTPHIPFKISRIAKSPLRK
jgi:hypothetical protein